MGCAPITGFRQDRLLKTFAKSVAADNLAEDKKPIVFVTGYYFRNLHMVWDSLIAISLRRQGSNVLGLSTGSFFKEECLYFGGKYLGVGREKEISRTRLLEHLLWRRILRLPHYFIEDFAQPGDDVLAKSSLEGLTTIDSLRNFSFLGVPIGKEAAAITLNMADLSDFTGAAGELRSLKNHSSNVMRYVLALNRFFDRVEVSTVVSNWPFYYKWSVPYTVGRQRKIDFFCYWLSEKNGAFSIAKNPQPHSVWDLTDVEKMWSMLVPGVTNFDGLLSSTLAFFDRPERSDRYVQMRKGKRSEADFTANAEAGDNPKIRVLVPLNVQADAAVLFGAPGGGSYIDFLDRIAILADNCPDIDFIWKAHPGEVLAKKMGLGGDSLETILRGRGLLGRKNVQFLPPNSSLRVSDLLPDVHFVLCYTSTVIFEASMAGVPCIQTGFSPYYDFDFTVKPKSFAEVQELILGRKPLGLEDNFSELAMKTYLLYYVYGQVDLGLYIGDDTGPPAKFKRGVTLKDLLQNPFLMEISRKMKENEPWFSEDSPPPASGGTRITSTGLDIRA